VASNTERDPPHVSTGLLHSKPWQVAMIGLGTAATQLDTAVNIAFPAITRGFGLAIGDIQWVVISYVLTYASLLLALGRIGDTVGHAMVFRVGLIWSAVALFLVSWSPSYGAMLVFRCLQGVGAALVLSCGAALVTSLYGEERRSRALGIYTMMLSFGLMLGPLLGGALTAVWDWPAVFLFRIPIAIAALLLLRAMPVSPPRPASDRFDVLGGIALTLGLVTMLLALNRLREFSAVWFPPRPLRPLFSASHAPRVRSLPSAFSGNRRLRFSISSACWPTSRHSRSGCWCRMRWRASPAIR
jgi:MFS family permease